MTTEEIETFTTAEVNCDMAISEQPHKIFRITGNENSRLNLDCFKRITAEFTDGYIKGRMQLGTIQKVGTQSKIIIREFLRKNYRRILN